MAHTKCINHVKNNRKNHPNFCKPIELFVYYLLWLRALDPWKDHSVSRSLSTRQNLPTNQISTKNLKKTIELITSGVIDYEESH